jgi:hypothetical protein
MTIKMVENKLKIKKHASPSTVLVKFKIQGSQQEKSGIPSIHHFIFLSIFLLWFFNFQAQNHSNI